MSAFGSHLNIDLQQRAVEFGVLCKSHDHLRGPILERMPPIPSDRLSKRAELNGEGDRSASVDLLSEVTNEHDLQQKDIVDSVS